MKRILLSDFLLLNLISCATGEKKSIELSEGGRPQKIITAGGTITEIVYSLGFGDQIIATDRTSTYPKEMQALPSIGYRNQIILFIRCCKSFWTKDFENHLKGGEKSWKSNLQLLPGLRQM